MKKPQTTTGSVGITRRNGGFYITCRDEASGIDFAEFKMTGKQFADAITGLHGQDCELTVRMLHLVGKKMEHKKVKVFAAQDYDYTDLDMIPSYIWANMVFPHEQDGWKVEKDNWGNFHNRIHDGERLGYMCMARRWI